MRSTVPSRCRGARRSTGSLAVWLGAVLGVAADSFAAPGLRLLEPVMGNAGSWRVGIALEDSTPLSDERAARIALLHADRLAPDPVPWREVPGPRALLGGILQVEHAGAVQPSVAAFYAARETVPPAPVTVRTAGELRAAVGAALPGARILLAPGTYSGGFYFANLKGAPGMPIVLAAADPQDPPRILGGANGMHFTDPEWVELQDLVFSGATGNGLNIDDGGSFGTPARQVVLRRLRVSDVGPQGNRDGIKLSGVVNFRVEDCTLERWGLGGSAIDMVGCHDGVIVGNVLRHSAAAAGAGANGVQAKGGTRGVVIRRNRIEHAGARALNIGGSTGLEFFRPALQAGEDHWEAKDIRVEGNTLVGSTAPVAFVGVDGAVVRFNTIYRPERWAIRILQETTATGFVPCRNGVFSDNLVVFHSTQWSSGGVNVGANTAPETFQFARNWWYCLDAPARSRPSLPVAETAGTYGQSPQFRDAENGDLRLQPGSPAAAVGAEALSE